MAQRGVLFRCKRIMDTVFAFANGKNTWISIGLFLLLRAIPQREGFFSQQRKQLACKVSPTGGVTVRALQHSEASITKQADIFIIAPAFI